MSGARGDHARSDRHRNRNYHMTLALVVMRDQHRGIDLGRFLRHWRAYAAEFSPDLGAYEGSTARLLAALEKRKIILIDVSDNGTVMLYRHPRSHEWGRRHGL